MASRDLVILSPAPTLYLETRVYFWDSKEDVLLYIFSRQDIPYNKVSKNWIAGEFDGKLIFHGR